MRISVTIMKDKLPRTFLSSHVRWETPTRITLIKSNYGSFGLSILVYSNMDDIPNCEGIYIYRVLSNSSAAIDYGLRKGDRILKIEDIPADQLNRKKAEEIIQNAENSLTLVIQKYAYLDDEVQDGSCEINGHFETTEDEMIRKYSHLDGEIIYKKVDYSEYGLGIMLSGKNSEKSKHGVFINKILNNSPLLETFAVDDELLQVNEITTENQNHVVAAGNIKAIKDKSWYVVGLRRPINLPRGAKKKNGVCFELTYPEENKRKTEQIVEDTNCLMSFPSNNKKVGIKVIGSIDENIGGIIIIDICSNGAAFDDGRLGIGDQILKYSGINLAFLTTTEIVDLLNQDREEYKFLILRGKKLDSCCFDGKYEINSITLNALKKRKNGITIENRENSPGTYLTFIDPKYSRGKLRIGDWITSIDDEDVSHMNSQELSEKMRSISKKSVVKIARLPIFKSIK